MRRADKSDLKNYLRYSEFINSCKNKIYPNNIVLHKHHIVPKHLWSDYTMNVNDKSNIIYLSVKDHAFAHVLYANAYESDTIEYIMNMRSARVLNKKSIRDKETLDKISQTYAGSKNPFYGKQHNKKTRYILRNLTRKLLTNVSYEERYGDRAEHEKEKRREGVRQSWKNMTNENRALRRKNISKSLIGKMEGSKNPFATPVIVNGKHYGSIADAKRELGVSSFILKKHYKVIKLERKKK